MNYSKLKITFLTVALTAVAATLAAAAGFDPAFLEEHPVLIEKQTALALSTVENLRNRDGDTTLVWVMFTDKGISDQASFDALAAASPFTERKARRRAKMDLNQPVFADLPVNQSYLQAVADAGGQLRRITKWLNGASFTVPTDQLNEIAALPFVREIRPVGLWKRPADPTAEPVRVDHQDPLSLSPDVLSYGLALNQVTQINVPAVHEQGYDGSGVTLAIFDTGYRKTHEAFANHYAEGRVLAEWDFIFNDGNTSNESGDYSTQWNHGTYIWSTSAGYVPGTLIGPAYKANFILCKTEDVRSETQVEEDNWVAALEWVDSIGADVVTSSLSYLEWDDGTGYDYSDLDGETAVTSIAASMAASMGIVVCNSAGNSGPSSPSMSAPVDAFDIVTVGAVNASGDLASFSSRGPTYDGRIKPEVLAQGVATQCAVTNSDASYGGVSGTSLSTPLVAGVACLLVQARPNFTPQMIRSALMETADNASSPNNNLGWGIVDANAALNWGVNFYSDVQVGEAPMVVHFYDSSSLASSAWTWDFGDGDSSISQNPQHGFQEGGAYTVSLEINTSYGSMTRVRDSYIIALADTVTFVTDSVYAGGQAVMSVNMTNSQLLNEMSISFRIDTLSAFSFDSATLGSRTSYFEDFQQTAYAPTEGRFAYRLVADDGGGSPLLTPGTGEIMKIYVTTDDLALGGLAAEVDSSQTPRRLNLTSPQLTYDPVVHAGQIITRYVMRGDVNGDFSIDIADVVYLVTWMFQGGPAPIAVQAADVNANLQVGIDDLVYLVDYEFNQGPPPVTP
ncbi:MAG TPA: S8 family serine peptidase [candidate division Zixibacteria bacterium]|nr:S8 family serine peptidase [candidate division Zixibacteria bacterium]